MGDTMTDEDIDLIDYGLSLRAKTPKEGLDKYGDVEFADDKNKKYPIDTEEHIRAAWNYINKKKNAAEYSDADLKAIKDKIIEAWKDKINPEGPPSARQAREGTLHVANHAPQAMRDAELEYEERAKDGDDRRVTIAFSSETPVAGRSGMEVLDHGDGADFSRLNNGAPLLLGHNPWAQIGVVEKAWKGPDHKGRAVVRFSRNPDADAIYQDVKDGIRRNISVGYDHGDPHPEVDSAGHQVMRIHNWTPLELSVVPIPADASVGVGRAIDSTTLAHTDHQSEIVRSKTMSEVDIKTAQDESVKAERQRVSAINATRARLVKMEVGDANALADKAIEDGTDQQEFLARSFALLESKGAVTRATGDGTIGMTDREARSFSLQKMIQYSAEPSAKNREAAAFEIDVCAAARDLSRSKKGSFSVPLDVLRAKVPQATRAALGVSGSDIVATHLLAQDFVEYLYNQTIVRKAGAFALDGLVGDVTIPTRTGTATSYWLGTDTSALTESETSFGQISMSPSQVTGFSKYSRQLLAQSTPAVEQLVRSDLAQVLAIAQDEAAINGSGSGGQPTGILNTSGIGTVALGTNGGAPTWESVVNLVGLLMKANAYHGKLGWAINGQGFETLANTPRIGTTYPVFILNDPFTSLIGHPVYNSQQIPSNLTKGTGTDLSAVIFANWGDLILGGWGGLDVLVDPYTYASSSEVAVYAYQLTAVALRHTGSFAAIVDMITT
ncbi:MAG: phage major capsid protein [Patescibacteria group bacterium]|nr:phage major capsid protein [Patescibacteria group bacterium]